MNYRKGISLVELLAVMAVGSAVVGVAVGMLHTVLRAEAVARERLQTRGTVSFLARQFRSDAHAAATFGGVGQDGSTDERKWQFVLVADHKVQYTMESDQLVREESIGGEVRKRDAFVLPGDTVATIGLRPDSERIVSLQLLPRPDAEERARAIRIEACLGMNHRFADRPEELR